MTHIGLNAHLLSKQAGYRSAGIHQYIHHLLTHLPQAAPDYQYTAMVGAAQDAQYPAIQMQQAPFDTESPTKRILWEQVLQPFQLRQFDLYHSLAFVAPLILTKPMLVTVYDLTFIRYPERLTKARRWYLRYFTELTCQRADRIIAISASTGRDLTELLGIDPSKIDVTPLGYDTSRYTPLAKAAIAAFRQQKGLPERFWFFLGTLEPRKNLVTLIEAYAALPKHERLPLILGGGKGWQTESIFQALERYHLNNEIQTIGFVPTEEIALWYNAAEVFVYPSVFEGFGLPVLEAMACGTPVITSNVSSLPEVAEGVGLCLPPDDSAAWTESLRRVYHDIAWRESARVAGLQKAQAFQWSTTAQLTIASYQRVLGV